MDDRVVEFIRALRGAGVRVSVAESGDALAALERLDTSEREWFKSALRSSLVKDHQDQPVFERLFPIYFSPGPPPMLRLQDVIGEEDLRRLEELIDRLGLQLDRIMERLLRGQGLTRQEILRALDASGLPEASDWRDLDRLSRQLRRRLGLADLAAQLESLLQALQAAGMPAEALRRLADALRTNLAALEETLRQAAAAGLADRMARHPRPEPVPGELTERPFASLSEREQELLRREAARLAARLRTRLALRRKRGKGRQLDAKATLRANLTHGGVPFEIVPRTRRRKAKFTLLCDVSTSMRPVASFLLYLLFQIQDQVARTRCFAYIDRLVDVSHEFAEHRPSEAVTRVLSRLPPGHYNTDLGRCLDALLRDHPDAVNNRTTVVFCADARNNFRPPREDLLEQVVRRARRVIWFNPEEPRLWGTEDSDMLRYAPRVSAVRQVSNLRQLGEAIDRLFA